MANAGRKMSFVNFANVKTAPGSDWITRELNAREWGMTPLKVTPQKMFDAVIYIDTVTPPAYLGGR
jgi:erythromycin esterase-like protein